MVILLLILISGIANNVGDTIDDYARDGKPNYLNLKPGNWFVDKGESLEGAQMLVPFTKDGWHLMKFVSYGSLITAVALNSSPQAVGVQLFRYTLMWAIGFSPYLSNEEMNDQSQSATAGK